MAIPDTHHSYAFLPIGYPVGKADGLAPSSMSCSRTEFYELQQKGKGAGTLPRCVAVPYDYPQSIL
jgi:hypothetical protein